MNRVAVVTGGTSGIGLETALALSGRGLRVYVLSRRPFSHTGLCHLVCDITDEVSVQNAVRQIVEAEGRINILINNAGFGISGAIEFTDTQDAKRLFDADFFGMVRMNRAVIPQMRAQGGGRIVNISSVAAPCALPFQAYYSAAKAAVNDYTLAAANELRPFGITLCAVQPGDIRTGFTAAREKSAVGDEVYGGRIARSVGKMERDEQGGMSPAKAGAFICRVALGRGRKPIYTIGFSYRCVALAMKLLPARVSNYLIGRLYAR